MRLTVLGGAGGWPPAGGAAAATPSSTTGSACWSTRVRDRPAAPRDRGALAAHPVPSGSTTSGGESVPSGSWIARRELSTWQAESSSAGSRARVRRCPCCTVARSATGSFDGLAADLLPGFTTAAYQQRGVLPSTLSRRLFDIGTYADDARAVRGRARLGGSRATWWGTAVGRLLRAAVVPTHARACAGRTDRRPARGRGRWRYGTSSGTRSSAACRMPRGAAWTGSRTSKRRARAKASGGRRTGAA